MTEIKDKKLADKVEKSTLTKEQFEADLKKVRDYPFEAGKNVM
jgi:hypothetical protein